MSAIGGGGNYISDGAIMAWLATQQDRVYGDLRDSMDLSESRAEFADALNDIKAHLQEANKSHDFSKVDADLQAFTAKYGSNPEFAEICDSLTEMATTIHNNYRGAEDYKISHAEYIKDLQAWGLRLATDPNHAGEQPKAPPEPVKSYTEDQVKIWTGLIDGKLDVSSKNDQLTMIHIQELKATLDQGSQLASTFISSGDKTSSAIINNIA